MAQTIPAIDMWAPIVPAREIMAYAADHFPPPQLGYLRVFWKGEASLEAFRRAALAMACDDAQVAMLDAARITRALITARADSAPHPLEGNTGTAYRLVRLPAHVRRIAVLAGASSLLILIPGEVCPECLHTNQIRCPVAPVRTTNSRTDDN